MPVRDAESILTELQATLASAHSGSIGRVPLVEQLVDHARRLLDDYVHALAQEQTKDRLRLEFLLATPGGFDVMVAGKIYGVSTRAEIDEAIAALDPNCQQIGA